MTKSVSNVQISSDTFYGLITKTNVLLDALSNEIVTTANTIFGSNTSGNASVLGVFSANTLTTEVLRGGTPGNTAGFSTLSLGLANSTTSSNVVIRGYAANVVANTLNITSNVNATGANVFINSANVALTGNLHFRGNTTVTNILVTANSTAADVTLNGNNSFVNTTSFVVNSVSTITGNTSLKSNTTTTVVQIQSNNTTSNVTISSNNTTITSNLALTGNLCSITGNLAVNTSTLFVDSSNNRVGLLTTTPNYALHITGSNTSSMFAVEYTNFNTLFDIGSNSSSIIAKTGTGDTLVMASNGGIGSGWIMIAANGNIGIANATPDSLVTIGAGTKVYSNGTFQTSGDLICTGDLYANIVFMGGSNQATVTATVCPIVPPNTIYSSQFPGPYSYLVFSNTTPQIIDVIGRSSYQAVKYTLQVQDDFRPDEVFMTEVSMITGYGNAHSTQFGTIFTNTAFVEVSVGSNTTDYWIQAAPTAAYLSAVGGTANLQFRGVRQKCR